MNAELKLTFHLPAKSTENVETRQHSDACSLFCIYTNYKYRHLYEGKPVPLKLAS